MKNDYLCSPMNYMGGKYKLLPQLLPLFPKDINIFVDLFCGGCNVGINIISNESYFNDNLTYLISLYEYIQKLEKQEIINFIKERIKTYNLSLTNTEGYNKLRTFYNEYRNPLDLFVITCYSFNHQIRFNNSHQLNVPFGKNRSQFNDRIYKNLISFIDVLKTKTIHFSSKNFDEFDFSKLTSEDFVYCDPPYLITTGTYNDGKRGFTGWSKHEELLLLQLLDKLNKRNIKFGLSNVLLHKGKENKILTEWCNDNKYNIHHLNMDYSNSNYHTINGNTKSDEVLITNY